LIVIRMVSESSVIRIFVSGRNIRAFAPDKEKPEAPLKPESGSRGTPG